MRQQISRIIFLVVMFGLLVFASAPSSKAVPQSIGTCCFDCKPVYSNCINSGNSEFNCCRAYRACTRQCDPAAICECGID